MKKYKHIKTGHIAVESQSGKNYKVSFPQSYTIPKWMIDESREWIEVIERNFEIQTFKRNDANLTFTIGPRGEFFLPGLILGTEEKTLLSNPHNIIYSVKRLSDGVVFTIGDSVMYTEKTSLVIGLPFIIDNIFLRNDDRILLRSKDNLMCEFIEDVEISNKILFTTTDGVDIFKGDKYYILTDVTNSKRQIIKEVESLGFYEGENNKLTFSSRDKAQEHMIFQTQLLSIRDVQDLLGKNVNLHKLVQFAIKSLNYEKRN